MAELMQACDGRYLDGTECGYKTCRHLGNYHPKNEFCDVAVNEKCKPCHPAVELKKVEGLPCGYHKHGSLCEVINGVKRKCAGKPCLITRQV